MYTDAMASDFQEVLSKLQPNVESDFAGNQFSYRALSKHIFNDEQTRFVIVRGPPGSGKTAMCKALLSKEGIIMLDLGTHYVNHINGTHTNANSQMDPKQVMRNFATTNTLAGGMGMWGRGTKVLWIDDYHVLISRDRMLPAALLALQNNPWAHRCKFVLCINDASFHKVNELVKSTAHVVVKTNAVGYKHMFARVSEVLTQCAVEFDDARVLSAAKTANGSWHDMVTNIKHWFDGTHPNADESSKGDEMRLTRDLLQGMSSTDIIRNVIVRHQQAGDAFDICDYDVSEMFTLAYENWMQAIKPHMMKRVYNAKRSKADASCKVVSKITAMHDVFANSLIMDAEAGSFDMDYELRAISSCYRYGSMIHHINALRSENAKDASSVTMTSVLPRVYVGSRKHPAADAIKRRMLHGDDDKPDMLWIVMADGMGNVQTATDKHNQAMPDCA